jgi:hypothetical protein
MAFTPQPPYPKQRGDTVRSEDWNATVDEVLRLEKDKVDRAGDAITGPLTVAGALAVATVDPKCQFQVGGDVAGIGIDSSDGSPNAGYVRFGDNSGWKLHFGRSHETPGGPVNAGTTGALATLQDNGYLGLGTTAPFAPLQVTTELTTDDIRYGAYISSTGTGNGTRFPFWVTATEGGGDRWCGIFQGSNPLDTSSGFTVGVLADTSGPGPGPKYGLYARASGGGQAYGGYFSALASGGGQAFAGYFNGNVHVAGTLSKAAGSFLFDHPLDPLGKTLRHNFVESPENLCLYRGKVTLDERGRARVRLPRYFPALTDEEGATVHLTPVGQEPFATSYQWNQRHTGLTVHGTPGAEVAWLVLADRDDPVIRQLARPGEESTGNGNFERGKLLNPEAFGEPPERGVHFEATSMAAMAPPGVPPR